ncbi:GNAT family N-acetyltransferase [Clostridium sp. YIM B02515]|uniref:GNAT family N-acetyltransferase n=1 Tax=Clostridium rhizosphaerae TaxID=2803861 RepID=A0ABS1TDI4_9CLOT|nr:GNAT family N-acetyltransferase [Clostridium rhizosphaerae]MBL4937423.1 GNAT family N-acetyltransferase [Clostridium rhizosphaerae]
MNIKLKFDCDNINWEIVCEVIEKAGLSTHPVKETQIAFENSFACVFVFDDDNLIGTGRAISDGVFQAGIYDIAVLPEYHKKGIGRVIMEGLESKLQNMNIILYANPTAQSFYKKLGYSKMLTGMAKFKNEESMRNRGFIE